MTDTASIFKYLHDSTPILVFWTMAFSVYTIARIGLKVSRRPRLTGDGPVMTELAGLPLTFIHSVCFYMAAVKLDWVGIVIFAWWGPGFLTVIVVMVVAAIRKSKVDWYPHRIWISWACKLNYVAVVIPCFYYGYTGMVFAYSVWIINDQMGRLYLIEDADRLRRTFDDRWLTRVAYPAGLFLPWFYEWEYRWLFGGYGIVLFLMWSSGVWRVSRQGKLKVRPQDVGLLRNMVYFKPRK